MAPRRSGGREPQAPQEWVGKSFREVPLREIVTAPVITQMLPAEAVGVAAHEHDWATHLLPSEAALVARAVEKRRWEFAAGRNCARRALAELGWSGFPLLHRAGREPVWPPGVVGSITHCDGYCAAAVAPKAQLTSLGIDAERNALLPTGVPDLVCTVGEQQDIGGIDGVEVQALIFSAKEAVFKAWHPLTGLWLDYLDAALAFDVATGTFSVRLLPTAPLDELPGTFVGKFAATPEHVFTLVTVAG
jgi:4'-phosphopantetheinyl transferase EntD